MEILQHLKPDELKRLRQFLASPYFNSGAHVDETQRLFERIVAFHADENHPMLTKEVVFQEFYPDKIFQDNAKTALDALASNLFQLVRQFLAQVQFERDHKELHTQLTLARFYSKFALEERFWQSLKASRELLEEQQNRDAQHYFDAYRIEDEELSFRNLYNAQDGESNMGAVHQNLDRYYSILKLKFTSLASYQNHQFKTESAANPPLIQGILDLSEPGMALDIPANQILRLILAIFQYPDQEELRHSLDALIDQYEPLLSEERIQEVRAYQRVFWVREYHRKGDDPSRRKTFELYRTHLERGYFYMEGRISISIFRNLIISALKLREFDWAKTFLDTHQPEQISGTRYPEEAHRLNFAEYYFHLKKYDEAQANLVYRLFEHPVFSLAADLLLVKIYHETDDELLETRTKALDQKVRRAKISPLLRNQYLNFLSKLNKISKLRWQSDARKKEKLMDELKTTPEIISREWLIEALLALK